MPLPGVEDQVLIVDLKTAAGSHSHALLVHGIHLNSDSIGLLQRCVFNVVFGLSPPSLEIVKELLLEEKPVARFSGGREPFCGHSIVG